MRHLLLGIVAALSFMASAPDAEAQTIVNVEPYASYVCIVTYSNGVRTIAYCPNDWPPAGNTLNVVCNCEHLGSPFDDLCEVQFFPFALGSTYSYTPVGRATIPYPPSPYDDFVRFACPPGVPPNAQGCTVRAKVTSPWGAYGSAICVSN